MFPIGRNAAVEPASEAAIGANAGSDRLAKVRMHSFGRLTRIAVLLPVVFLALVGVIIFVVATTWQQQRHQAGVLSEIATRDVKIRSAAFSVANAASEIDTQLLGVLGAVQSSSAVIPIVEQQFGDLQSSWSTLIDLFARTNDGKLIELTHRYAKLSTLRSRILEALRGAYVEQVAQVYDDWLDNARPFRADLQTLVARLDQVGAEKIVSVLKGANHGAALSLIFGAIGGVVGLIAGLYVVFGVVRPLAGIERAVSFLKHGQYQTPLRRSNRRDEIGQVIEALLALQASLAENEGLRTDHLKQVERAEDERRELLARFTRDLEASVCTVAEALGKAAVNIEGSIAETRSFVGHTEEQASLAAEAAARANENVLSVSTASTQLRDAIAEIGQRVAQSTEVVNRASMQAAQANARMSTLRETMSAIEQVISIIRSVAAKTNLLALNATIEAARAGESGRGFTVVATEVKQLAAQTAKATDEIATQIAAVQHSGESVLTVIDAITMTIQEVSGIALEIAHAIEEQQLATAEIARSIDEVALGAGQIAGSARQMSNAAVETGRRTEQLKAAASEIRGHSVTLEGQIGHFLGATQVA